MNIPKKKKCNPSPGTTHVRISRQAHAVLKQRAAAEGISASKLLARLVVGAA